MRIIEMEQLLEDFMDFIYREEIALVSISRKTPMEHIADYDPVINKFLEERKERRAARIAPSALVAEKVAE